MIAASFNFYEAFIWFFVAGISLVYAVTKNDPLQRRLFLFSVPVWVAFGISDFVEIQTGGWWKPWWMLAWKGVCLISIIVLYSCYYKRSKRLR